MPVPLSDQYQLPSRILPSLVSYENQLEGFLSMAWIVRRVRRVAISYGMKLSIGFGDGIKLGWEMGSGNGTLIYSGIWGGAGVFVTLGLLPS